MLMAGKRLKMVSVRSRTKPFYSLTEVRTLIDSGDYFISPEARENAGRDFGWRTEEDILDAIKKLRPGHFYKCDYKYHDSSVVFDFYKAGDLKGENVYTHFYIDRQVNKLVIDSFKEI
jgi:Motility quorum-sensing regulator, toxin of MqsA